MKKALFLVLKQSEEALEVLQTLKSDGYNATMVSTDSLHHAFLNSEEDHHFYSLRHLEKEQLNQSTLGIFIVDDVNLEKLKENIRIHTDNFKKAKGFMYSVDLNDYEGSI